MRVPAAVVLTSRFGVWVRGSLRMEIVPSTFLALIVALGIMLLGSGRCLWLYFAVTPLGMAAAFNLPAVGGTSILVADFAMLVLVASFCARPEAVSALLGSMRPLQPGFFLFILLAWCVISAVLMPRIFAGQTEVFGIARLRGQIGIVSIPLEPGGGNLSQLLRMLLNTLSFFVLTALFRLNPNPRPVLLAMAAAAVVHVLLGWADVLTYQVGASQLLDPIRTANYALADKQVLAGVRRMIGGFPEASAFGYYTIGLFGFWLQYWLGGRRSWLAFWLMIALLVAMLRSTSSSAYVALAILLVFVAFINRSGKDLMITRRGAGLLAILSVLIPITAMGLVVAYQTSPSVGGYFDRLLFDKLNSDSGVERMSWNTQAFTNFVDTHLLGAGLGSVRASNWLLTTLGNIGIIGFFCFVAFLVSLARAPEGDKGSERARVIRALKIGCLALFCRAMVVKATPNLELIFFSMAGIAVGLSRGAQWVSEAAKQATPSIVAVRNA